ncbi:MAG TPA: carbamoyltransferase HypF, partial [Bacteroidetes bacterium]|nr:carbamoyltransferase HypF [Bacteroidota bacterium]
MGMIVEAYKIEIKGLVQGVGFRPFIYKLAKRHSIRGNVENNNEGVLVQAEGNRNHLQQFIKAMKAEAPVASKIAAINIKVEPITGFENFSILPSHS